MRKKKSKKRNRLRPAPFLWIFLFLNILFGLVFSRMTSAVNVRAASVPAYDQTRVKGILAKLRDVPCLQVNPKKIETEVMALPDVDKAELTRNIFGNALLLIRYRSPVAVLSGQQNVVLSTDGVLYKATELPGDLPVLKLPKGGPPTLVGYGGNWQPGSLAALAVYSRQNYPKTDVVIQVSERGVVCLNIGSGRVILGSCDDLDLKLKTLESRLQKNPQELSEEDELNLTVPSFPAVVPKKVVLPTHQSNLPRHKRKKS